MFFFASISAQCQDIIKYGDPDLVKLEQLVKNKIDVFRESNGLKKLWNDSALFLSAKGHNEYIRNSGKQNIFEPVRKLGTPQKRSEAAGATSYFTSEIISVIPVDTFSSPQGMADYIFRKHMVNDVNKAHLLSGIFNIQGLAIGFTTDLDSIIVVHDLADSGNDYIYRKCSHIFPYDSLKTPEKRSIKAPKTRYDWKLKSPKSEEQCKNILATYHRLKNVTVEETDGRLMIAFEKESDARQLLEGKKDGFAIEVVEQETYQCIENQYYQQFSRRNNLSMINGKLLSPKYSSDILDPQGYKDETEERFVKSLGNIKAESDKYEANAVLISNNRICKIIGQNKLCGQFMNYEIDHADYKDNFQYFEYEPKVDYDTLKLKIYYQPNQTEPDMKDIQPILDFVKKEGLVITKALVNANASIEGSKITNESIFTQRADYLVGLFEKEQTFEIRKLVKTQENWPMFYNQIKGTRFSILEFKDTMVARKFVNDSIEYFKKQLDEQRYATVSLFAVTKATREQFKVYAMNDFSKITARISEEKEKENEKQLTKLIKEAENIQLYLYDQYINNRINDEFIRALKIPKDDLYSNLHKNELFFKFRYRKMPAPISESDFFNGLNLIASSGKADNLVYYNILGYLLNHYGEEDVRQYQNSKYIGSLIEKSGGEGVTSDDLAKMYYHYNYLKTVELLDENKLSKAKTYLSGMYSYLLNNDTECEELISLTRYFMLFREYDAAYKIAVRLANGEMNCKQANELFLKLHYSDFWRDERTSDYYQFLFEASESLSGAEWCGLFEDKCGISYQIFDYEPLWKLYCLKKHN